MGLVAFDFDGTLSKSDMTVLLGEQKDVGTEVRGLAEQGLRGELDFATSLRDRVDLLEGLRDERVTDAFDRLRLRTGVADLIRDLRRSDVHVTIVTGSFEAGVEAALDRDGVEVDSIVANQLVYENGALTGEVEGPLVEGGKDTALEEIAAAEGIVLDRTVAIGDGVTDLPMLQVAGTAIGYDPVPEVERYCDEVVHSIQHLRLYFEQHDIIDA